jgi:hypothetical protein
MSIPNVSTVNVISHKEIWNLHTNKIENWTIFFWITRAVFTIIYFLSWKITKKWLKIHVEIVVVGLSVWQKKNWRDWTFVRLPHFYFFVFFHHPFLAVVAFQCGSHTRILCTEITSEYDRAGQLQSVPPKSNIVAAYNKRHTPIDCRRSAVTWLRWHRLFSGPTASFIGWQRILCCVEQTSRNLLSLTAVIPPFLTR